MILWDWEMQESMTVPYGFTRKCNFKKVQILLKVGGSINEQSIESTEIQFQAWVEDTEKSKTSHLQLYNIKIQGTYFCISETIFREVDKITTYVNRRSS